MEYSTVSSVSVLGITYDLPVHDVPFPVYPGLHVQLYDPSVLLQKALTSQSYTLVVHSLISEKREVLTKKAFR